MRHTLECGVAEFPLAINRTFCKRAVLCQIRSVLCRGGADPAMPSLFRSFYYPSILPLGLVFQKRSHCSRKIYGYFSVKSTVAPVNGSVDTSFFCGFLARVLHPTCTKNVRRPSRAFFGRHTVNIRCSVRTTSDKDYKNQVFVLQSE